MTSINLFSKVFLIISALFILSSCEPDETSDDKKDVDNSLVVGYWLLYEGQTLAINDKGDTVVTAELNPKVVAHEFLADGTYKGHDLTGTFASETGTWSIDVFKKDYKDIEDATLSITTPSSLANKGQLFIDEVGILKFNASSLYSHAGNKKSYLYLETKKYEVYPYKENWALYVYEKQ
jgi:hypothetical protein